MPFLHLIFPGPLMRCRYSWAIPVLENMTALDIPGSKLGSPFTWSMNDNSSSAGRTRGARLLGVEVGALFFPHGFP